ncbi:MAG: MerR family transcriptional regulator [Candidatus Omnitrophica bacterium]|nr:MerR family transcriptional regulator [Candidatus Omnitrophota bacterium]
MGRNGLFIGELSKQTGVPTKTVRYYEQFGLLSKPKRTDSRYRLYTQEDVEKLKFIKKAQSFGLKLLEIHSIISCSKEGLEPCCDLVRDLFNRKIKEFENKIEELATMRNRLKEKLKMWVKPKQAKKTKYAVCPQIETERRKRK